MCMYKRTRNDSLIAGVCGGLGKWTGISSWIWRILAVIFFDKVLIVYLLFWFFTEEE
jgi:phage shock protein C